MMTKRKIIFLDIDGTLTEPGCNEPPASALYAIEEARKNGHLVFLCSGRNYDMLSPLLKYEFDGVIASSGGYIVYKENVLFDCPMTEAQKQKILYTLQNSGVYRTIECRNGSFTDESFREFLIEHESEGRNSELLRWREQIEESLHILPMRAYQGQPVYKVVVMSPVRGWIEEPKRILEDEFHICMYEPDEYGITNAEVVNRKFDKGQAIVRVCEYLNIPVNDTIAFGDSMNDQEMLQTAQIGICMGNGSEQLKKIADQVCPAVSEDGLYQAFLKLELISDRISDNMSEGASRFRRAESWERS